MTERKSFENISLDSSINAGLLDGGSNSINYTQFNDIKLGNFSKENESSVIETIKRRSTLITKDDLESKSLSPDCTIGTSNVSSNTISDIIKYDLNTYLEEHLEERYWFFRKVSIENIMKWQGSIISEPLTKIIREHQSVAIQLFKNLLSYMNDRKSSKNVMGHVRKFLKLTMTAPEEIRDESYIQVLKQIKDHKDPQKALKGWDFLAIIASCYVPSSKLFYSILKHLLFEIKNNEDSDIKCRANYIFIRLYKTFEIKRKALPSEKEINHIEKMKSITIPVYFFSEISTNIEVESYTTVRDLKTILMKQLQFNVSRIPYYSIFEVCKKKDNISERFLEENDRICDVMANWQNEIEECLKKKEEVVFKLYLKIFLHYPYADTDVDTVTALYTQSVYDVNRGKYVLDEKDIITFASLQLLTEFNTNHDNAYQSLQKNLEKYVPADQINLNPGVYWIQKIMELYTGLKASSTMEAKLTFLEHLKTSPIWESHTFNSKYSLKNLENTENFPEDLIIAIKPEGISILSTDKTEIINYPYHVIANWGISATFFVIIVSKSEGQVVKHYFECSNTRIIQALLDNYTNLIAGKTITEIQNITLDYEKRFPLFKKSKTILS